jgi:hypothetical protein
VVSYRVLTSLLKRFSFGPHLYAHRYSWKKGHGCNCVIPGCFRTVSTADLIAFLFDSLSRSSRENRLPSIKASVFPKLFAINRSHVDNPNFHVLSLFTFS